MLRTFVTLSIKPRIWSTVKLKNYKQQQLALKFYDNSTSSHEDEGRKRRKGQKNSLNHLDGFFLKILVNNFFLVEREKDLLVFSIFISYKINISIDRSIHTNCCFASKEPGRASRPIERGTTAAAGGDEKRREKEEGMRARERKSEGLCG